MPPLNRPHDAGAAGEAPLLSVVAGPSRCDDLHAWRLAVRQAGDLSLRRGDGRPELASRTVKAGLLYLATFADGPAGADPGGNIRPGLRTVCADLELSRRAALAVFAAGVQHGYLVRMQAGHRGRAAVYALSLPAVDNLRERVRTSAPKPGKGADYTHERVRTSAPRPSSDLDTPTRVRATQPPLVETVGSRPDPTLPPGPYLDDHEEAADG